MKDSWYSFLERKSKLHTWENMNSSAYAFEWPDGWIGIVRWSYDEQNQQLSLYIDTINLLLCLLTIFVFPLTSTCNRTEMSIQRKLSFNIYYVFVQNVSFRNSLELKLEFVDYHC